MKWTLSSLEDWNRVAQDVIAQLRDGDILTLSGPLGAGKTTFTQALAQALGAEKMPKSPTFSMMRTYRISHEDLTRMIHVDAYRIENEADLVPLDLDEELSVPGTILVIEWPEQIPRWLEMRPHKRLAILMNGESRMVAME